MGRKGMGRLRIPKSSAAVLERTSQYEQTLLTVADDALVGRARLQGAQNFRVVRGNVSKLD